MYWHDPNIAEQFAKQTPQMMVSKRARHILSWHVVNDSSGDAGESLSVCSTGGDVFGINDIYVLSIFHNCECCGACYDCVHKPGTSHTESGITDLDRLCLTLAPSEMHLNLILGFCACVTMHLHGHGVAFQGAEHHPKAAARHLPDHSGNAPAFRLLMRMPAGLVSWVALVFYAAYMLQPADLAVQAAHCGPLKAAPSARVAACVASECGPSIRTSAHAAAYIYPLAIALFLGVF